MNDEFDSGLNLPPQTYYFRVTGNGKFACLWAQNKTHAKERFQTEFFPGSPAESAKQITE